jgi:uncharacterized membrane protein YvbJ
LKKEQLKKAIERGDLNQVKKIVNEGIDIDCKIGGVSIKILIFY